LRLERPAGGHELGALEERAYLETFARAAWRG
jgi:hypothetical protein